MPHDKEICRSQSEEIWKLRAHIATFCALTFFGLSVALLSKDFQAQSASSPADAVLLVSPTTGGTLRRLEKAADDGTNYPSYKAGSFACESERNTAGRGSTRALYGLNYQCDSLFPPTAWQKKSSDGEADYDLIIVGGGIGGAYLANRLVAEFRKKNQEPPKIALFERTQQLGGRLQSGYGTGALGLGVAPRQPELNNAPLQEYGGMRIDPFRYPLIYNEVIQEGQRLYGEEMCQGLDKCNPKERSCCDPMLRRMDVGAIRFATAETEMGILSDSDVRMPSETYDVDEGEQVRHSYSLEDIAKRIGTPFDKCLQLVVAIDAYYDHGKNSTLTLEEATDGLCSKCKGCGIEGMCDLCDAFPDPAAAIISCSGYDLQRSRDLSYSLRFLKGVLNIDNQTYLYLLRHGFQRFVMSLLRANGELGIAPQYGRTLVELSLEDGQDAGGLAETQVNSLSSPVQYSTVPTKGTVRAKFADGSVVTGRSVFLNILPFDLPQIQGLRAWGGPANDCWRPTVLAKVVMGWKDPEKAPAYVFDTKPCVPGPCERLILDGGEGWMARQVWLWDPQTIMFYVLTADLNGDQPVNNMIRTANEEGMDTLVTRLMDEIRNATGFNVDDPDWARMKVWPAGSTAGFNKTSIEQNYNSSEAKLGGHISCPMGYNIPVYYGNSEASPNASYHGWVEGALDMVEKNLQSIATYLGLEGDIDTPLGHQDMTNEETESSGPIIGNPQDPDEGDVDTPPSIAESTTNKEIESSSPIGNPQQDQDVNSTASSFQDSEAYDCSTLSKFELREYGPGEQVVHHNKAFKCRRKKIEKCSIGGKYEPGVGKKSHKAWKSLGSCTEGASNEAVTGRTP